MSSSYFVRTGPSTFQPTSWTEGAWRQTEQHFSPIGGLLVHAIERHVAARSEPDGLLLAQISFDILGVVGFDEMEIDVVTLRAGRTIELLEATLRSRGRDAARARAWRLVEVDTSAVEGGQPSPMPPVTDLEPRDLQATWPGNYIRSLDVRIARAPVPGSGAAWISTQIDLVADEPSSELARFVMLVDTANGVATRESPREWMFPNVDLSLRFHRQPTGPWVGLDTQVVFGATGQGITSTVLHDVHGPVGRADQMLTVRPLATDA